MRLYNEELLVPRLIPKLEEHPLSAVRYCLFNTTVATMQSANRLLCLQPEETPYRCERGPPYREIICVTLFFKKNLLISLLGSDDPSGQAHSFT
jgi:hypothetical protein